MELGKIVTLNNYKSKVIVAEIGLYKHIHRAKNKFVFSYIFRAIKRRNNTNIIISL